MVRQRTHTTRAQSFKTQRDDGSHQEASRQKVTFSSDSSREMAFWLSLAHIMVHVSHAPRPTAAFRASRLGSSRSAASRSAASRPDASRPDASQPARRPPRLLAHPSRRTRWGERRGAAGRCASCTHRNRRDAHESPSKSPQLFTKNSVETESCILLSIYVSRASYQEPSGTGPVLT